MIGKLHMTPSIKKLSVSRSETVACPKCDSSITFYRDDKGYIDECGFETYSLKCRACESVLVGIIDPTDDTLLFAVSS
jgi:hypothetical protein